MFGGDDTGPTSATQGTGTEPSLARQAARGGLPGRCWGPKRRGGGARVSPNAGRSHPAEPRVLQALLRARRQGRLPRPLPPPRPPGRTDTRTPAQRPPRPARGGAAPAARCRARPAPPRPAPRAAPRPPPRQRCPARATASGGAARRRVAGW